MPKHLPICIFAAIGLVACEEQSHTVEFDLPVSSKQAELNAITDACNAPRDLLKIEGEAVHFTPQPDMDYDVAACVFNGIRDAGITNFGFVGNERYQTPEGQ